MALLSKANQEALVGPLNLNNPVVVQVLGICSALAVTAQLEPAIVMGLSVTIITAFSNLIISLIRNSIPNRIRIIVQLVGLIITNCILMGRLEAFAMMNKPWPSFLDGIGNGIGYAIILIIVGFVRELLGAGTLLGFQIIPDWCYEHGYVNNGMMTMPAMSLIIVGCVIWAHRAYNKELQ